MDARVLFHMQSVISSSLSLWRIRDGIALGVGDATRLALRDASLMLRRDQVAQHSLAVQVRNNLRHSTHIRGRVFRLDPRSWPHRAVHCLVASRRRLFGRSLVLNRRSFPRSYE